MWARHAIVRTLRQRANPSANIQSATSRYASQSSKPSTPVWEPSMPTEWARKPPPKYDEDIDSEDVSPFKIAPPVRPPNEALETKRARLVYMSRKRGILETDLLLSTFAKEYLPNMSMKEMTEYDALLEENDWDIYYWATGAKRIPDRVMKDGILMNKLVEHSKNKGKQILRMPDLSARVAG
ncbi:hypothetical protein SmJEL517_g02978 [Synchytrium microbalum]|uniref:Succinate dehydrogenase assembly factor 2, mitochondrial n=1 Tax=Synchytrium microbalum TaxID=1806994 RepID=A0A507CA73_9FUNG|nr:uncharacterized protein SmJEL517_g02978 [Synchytrium microbalum]TPX34405.1 hypothetical protein SmJEL517_g02978 [Synchytrium microbalum]